MLVSLALFVVCGDGAAVALVPRVWGAAASLAALPLGAALSGLILTALGLARIPLTISVWLVVVLGLVASVAARRHRGGATVPRAARAPGRSGRSRRWCSSSSPWLRPGDSV